jgi:hypothetical protein
MKTATSEIRFIAIRAYKSGIARQHVADIVGYHLNSVSRWIREYDREKRLESCIDPPCQGVFCILPFFLSALLDVFILLAGLSRHPPDAIKYAGKTQQSPLLVKDF